MTIWGIADLHLSFARPDRRERYAARWRDHAEKIATEWRKVVRPEDLVVIPGDISMAVNHRDLQPDLHWLAALPGTKAISPGNHDRWWNRVEAIRPMLRRTLIAVDGDAVATHGVVLAGARGVIVREEGENLAETANQVEKLGQSLAMAASLQTTDEPIIVLWHYPPFDLRRRPGPAVAVMEAAGVSDCVYGHLHAEGQWSSAVQGRLGSVRYHCVAADAVGFRPLRVRDSGSIQGGP